MNEEVGREQVTALQLQALKGLLHKSLWDHVLEHWFLFLVGVGAALGVLCTLFLRVDAVSTQAINTELAEPASQPGVALSSRTQTQGLAARLPAAPSPPLSVPQPIAEAGREPLGVSVRVVSQRPQSSPETGNAVGAGVPSAGIPAGIPGRARPIAVGAVARHQPTVKGALGSNPLQQVGSAPASTSGTGLRLLIPPTARGAEQQPVTGRGLLIPPRSTPTQRADAHSSEIQKTVTPIASVR